MESDPPATAVLKSPDARAATVRYMGFRCTSEGRSYRLRVDGGEKPRFVTVTIPNEAFAPHRARFQDAPELCVARVRRELESGLDLPDGIELAITPAELDERLEAARRSPDRRPRTPRPGP